jgi:hypothetical protein
MEKKKLLILRFLLNFTDLILLNMCLFVGIYLSNKYGFNLGWTLYKQCLFPANVLWVIITSLFRLYGEYTIYTPKDINNATWRSVFIYCLTFKLYTTLVFFNVAHTNYIIVFYALLIPSFLISRFSLMSLTSFVKFDFNKRTASVLAIASVGGHWIELLRLMPLFNNHEVSFISNKDNLANSVEGHGFYNVPDANKQQKMNLVKCFFAVLTRVIVLRPVVIITTGAAPGLMGIFIGRLFGIKTIWIDSIANVEKLSLSGAIAVKVAHKVYTQWEHLSTPKVQFSGSVI